MWRRPAAVGVVAAPPPSPQPSPQGGEGALVVAAKRKPAKRETDQAQRLRQDATEVEKLLWSKLRNQQLGVKFRRQEPILGFVADFVCHDHRLILELDGGQHAENQENDARRTAVLQQAGFRVLRFWNNDVNDNLEGVLNVILESLHQTSAPRRGGKALSPLGRGLGEGEHGGDLP
ncbi:MAG TPA: DUF559 domain-containing protein [Azospirillaceae bacterium]|nr:DUF559 domain-containing protein [Azospirillaceae bacterium]